MALRTRVWSAGKLLVLAGLLVATYILFAAASMRLALRASEVLVPDFTNRTANEASGAAASLGLALKVDESKRTDTKVVAGRIMTRIPRQARTARRQRTVRVWVSAGPRATIVPRPDRRERADRAAAARAERICGDGDFRDQCRRTFRRTSSWRRSRRPKRPAPPSPCSSIAATVARRT